MPEVWGLLPKAQDDNQLISEAIADAVDAHEADASAHLGVGESLEAHKTATIIDHLAGSILADKFTNVELDWDERFDTLSKWNAVGDAYAASCPGASLTVEYGGVETSTLANKDSVFNMSNNWSKYLMIECPMELSLDGTITVRFGIGNFAGGLENKGLGFVIKDDAIYGYYKNGTTVHEIDLDLTLGVVPKYLRAEWNPDTDVVRWWCNGVEVGSYSRTEENVSASFDVSFYMHTTAGSQSILMIRRMKVVRSI
jgi:hypothetical protein